MGLWALAALCVLLVLTYGALEVASVRSLMELTAWEGWTDRTRGRWLRLFGTPTVPAALALVVIGFALKTRRHGLGWLAGLVPLGVFAWWLRMGFAWMTGI